MLFLLYQGSHDVLFLVLLHNQYFYLVLVQHQ